MKAVAFTSTEAKIVDVVKPEAADDELLIKIRYSALDTALDPVINKDSSAAFLHKLTDPLFLGWHYSGVIEAVGASVPADSFKVGDEVFGHLAYSGNTTQGSLAEYITVKAENCARKPSKVEGDVAAASTTESLTALQALRDQGGLTQDGGQAVLINGAAGGVGIAAVQIAKRMGATITAICSTKDVDRIKKLGAHVVVDRKKTPDVLAELQLESFDVVFDTPTVLPAAKALTYLKPKGNLVVTAPHLGLWWGFMCSLVQGKGIKMFVVESKKADLELLGTWLDSGFAVDIDSTFPIKDIEEATARNRQGGKKGRVVVKIDGAW